MVSSNAQFNLAMLEFVARKLEDLKDEFIFIGGCTTALFISDSAVPDVRPTVDVDCIVDAISLSQYHQLEKRLRQKGFKRSNDIVCRWQYKEVILDIMPIDETILGFSNRWYEVAVKHSVNYQIAIDLAIKSLTAPYFLATKLEAFKQRGNNDLLSSHDFEDVITLIDGRSEIVDEISTADSEVRKYIAKFFADMLQSKHFHAALPGHLNYGRVTQDRVKIILDRIKKISRCGMLNEV